MKRVYGLTGGIACGKSTVSGMLRQAGACVVDADVIAREVVAPQTDGWQAVVEAFGTAVLQLDGQLDRPALGRIVFGDADARAKLNAIVHPRIAARSAQLLAEAQLLPCDPIFYDAALLVEQGTWRMFEDLVVVACDPQLQRERLAARDGLSATEIEARLASQLPLDQKLAVAGHVVWNNDDLAGLRHRVHALLAALRSSTESSPS